MSDEIENARPLPSEIWNGILLVLSKGPLGDFDAGSHLAAVAGLYDTLTPQESQYIASSMLSLLTEGLCSQKPLDAVCKGILSLVDPFFLRTDCEESCRMLIRSAFDRRMNENGDFSDLRFLGLALSDLSDRAAGASERWRHFYDRYKSNHLYRFDAFDIALAGTAQFDLASFETIVLSEEPSDWVAQRLALYAPSLNQAHSHKQLSNFLANLRKHYLRSEYLSIINGMFSLLSDDWLPSVGESDRLPEELMFSYQLIINEEKFGLQPDALASYLHNPSVKVIESRYSGIEIIDEFQKKVSILMDDLFETEKTSHKSTSSFSELPAEVNGRRKQIFAFPTYLTSTKSQLGYVINRYGSHRKLGVFFPKTSHTYHNVETLTDLFSVLKEVRRNSGKVYCLDNYAIHEIVEQELNSHPDLQDYFSDHLHSVRAANNTKLGSITPFIPNNAQKKEFVFLFDLAGFKQISRATTNDVKKSGWLANGKCSIIDHQQNIGVGIAFSKYLVPSLLQQGRWDKITNFVERWLENEAFSDALSELGIEVLNSSVAVKKNDTVTNLAEARIRRNANGS